MAEVEVIHDREGDTLTVWFGEWAVLATWKCKQALGGLVIATSVLQKAMREIAAKRGDLTLFALFKRANAPFGNWDLVVSAPWLERDRYKATTEVVNLLVDTIGRKSLTQLARVEVIRDDNPGLEFVLANFPVDDGELRLRDTELFGLDMDEGIIFRARRPAARKRARKVRRTAAGSRGRGLKRRRAEGQLTA